MPPGVQQVVYNSLKDTALSVYNSTTVQVCPPGHSLVSVQQYNSTKVSSWTQPCQCTTVQQYKYKCVLLDTALSAYNSTTVQVQVCPPGNSLVTHRLSRKGHHGYRQDGTAQRSKKAKAGWLEDAVPVKQPMPLPHRSCNLGPTRKRAQASTDARLLARSERFSHLSLGRSHSS